MALPERIAALVVREYLQSKGYSTTLSAFESEARVSPSARSRDSEYLTKQLNIEKLVRRNEKEISPLAAILEVILKYFVDRSPVEAQANQGLPLIHMEPSTSWDAFPASKDLPQRRQRHQFPSASGKADLLVLEDDIESDTIAGTGRSNLLQKVASIEESFKARRSTSKDGPSQQIKSAMSGSSSNDLQEQKLTFKKPHDDSQRRSSLQQGDAFNDVEDNVTFRQNVGDQSLPHTQELGDSALLLMRAPSRGRGHRPREASEVERPSSTAAIHSSYDLLCEDSDVHSGAASAQNQLAINSPKLTALTVHQERSNPAACSKDEPQPVAAAGAIAITRLASPALPTPWMVSGKTDGFPAAVSPISPAGLAANSRPISVQTAVELKKVALGSALCVFPEHWMVQALCFSDVPPLEYGLACSAEELGPLLAAVQALLLLEMLFGTQTDAAAAAAGERARRLRPKTKEERVQLLVQCLARALWRAGGEKQATLALPCHQNAISGGGRYKADGITEQLALLSFDTREELTAALQMHVDVFLQEGKASLVVLLYSLILSRGISRVADDIKDECSSLLVGDGATCTQNVLGLVTAGCAALDDISVGPAAVVAQSGSQARSTRSTCSRFDVGFLSLEEHYKRCHVGARLKTPRYPLWLVQAQRGRYGVLFSTKHELVSDWKAERRFDLFYYDVAARQDCEIRLTIDTTGQCSTASSGDDVDGEEATTLPPLELCISTKWAGAAISWNGTQPLR